MSKQLEARLARKTRIRKVVSGTQERPRLTVYKSLNHIYAQVIDDVAGVTLAQVGSNSKSHKAEFASLKKAEISKRIGGEIAKACLAKNISMVVFDRNGFPYHGRIAAVADGAREAGLKF